MTPTPDYRALSADAATRYREAVKAGNAQSTYEAAVDWLLAATYAAKSHAFDSSLYPDIAAKAADCVRIARALLAAPEAVGVADAVKDTVNGLMDIAGSLTSLGKDAWAQEIIEAAAVLTRCGTAHAAPVPVGERLPGVGDDSDVIRALVKAEAALADIGDAEREPGDDLAWCERRAAEALPVVREALAFCSIAHSAPVPVSPPSGHAYRYPDYRGGTTIRFNSGCEVNGSKPIEAVPYWFAPPHHAPEAVGVTDEVVENAARILYTAMRFERMESTPAWVERGNSDAQVIAREVARIVLTLYAHPAPIPVGERPWERDGWCDQVRWQQDQPAAEGAVNGC
jgi:hypothetical protein